VSFPDGLPISAWAEEIGELIRDHQVIVVAGETGSGKTTQLPKICLSIGRGVRGMIGHTQPRRIAARSVSERIAEELDVEHGREVGFQVRFTDASTPESCSTSSSTTGCSRRTTR
jgi:ATP-dependent helicase HrpA